MHNLDDYTDTWPAGTSKCFYGTIALDQPIC